MSMRGDAWVHAEVLRQVAKGATQCVGTREHVEIAETDRTLRGDLQRRDAAHQRRLARAVGAEQAEHASRYLQRDAVERTRAVGVDVGQVVDAQHGGSLPDRVWAGL